MQLKTKILAEQITTSNSIFNTRWIPNINIHWNFCTSYNKKYAIFLSWKLRRFVSWILDRIDEPFWWWAVSTYNVLKYILLIIPWLKSSASLTLYLTPAKCFSLVRVLSQSTCEKHIFMTKPFKIPPPFDIAGTGMWLFATRWQRDNFRYIWVFHNLFRIY